MSEDSVLQRGELALHELESPESVPAFARERDLQARTQDVNRQAILTPDGGQCSTPDNTLSSFREGLWP